MTPKLVRWGGGALVIGIVAMVAVGAIHDIMVGERDIRGEVVTLAAIAFIALATAALKLVQSRQRAASRKPRKKRKGAR